MVINDDVESFDLNLSILDICCFNYISCDLECD